jgi:O-antigen/teichoic acid export membrane protein
MFLSIKVVTSLMPPYQYGMYGIAMAVIAIFAYIFIGPVGLSINRYINEWSEQGYLQEIFGKYFYYLIVVSLFSGIFVGAQSENFYLGFFAGFFYLLSQAIATTLIPNLNMLGHSREFYKLLNLNVIFNILFGYFLIKLFGEKYEYWIFGTFLGNLLTSFWAYRYYSRSIFLKKIPIRKVYYRKYFTFSGFIFISSVFTWLYLMGYRFIAEDKLGYGALGIYLACAAIPSGIVSAYEQVVSGIYLPKLFRNIDQAKDAWQIYAKKIATTSVPVCLFIIFNSEILARYILPEEYSGAYKFIQYCAIAETMRVMISTFGYKFHGDTRTYLLIVPSILLALIANIIIFLFIDTYGATAIPIAMFFSGTLVVLIYGLIIGLHSISVFFFFIKYILFGLSAISLIIYFIGYLDLAYQYKDFIHFMLVSFLTGALFLYALSE